MTFAFIAAASAASDTDVKPRRFGSVMPDAPTFEVMMMIVFLKSTRLP